MFKIIRHTKYLKYLFFIKNNLLPSSYKYKKNVISFLFLPISFTPNETNLFSLFICGVVAVGAAAIGVIYSYSTSKDKNIIIEQKKNNLDYTDSLVNKNELNPNEVLNDLIQITDDEQQFYIALATLSTTAAVYFLIHLFKSRGPSEFFSLNSDFIQFNQAKYSPTQGGSPLTINPIINNPTEVVNINSAAMNTTSSISSTSAEVLNINSAAMNTTSSISSTSTEVLNINSAAMNTTSSISSTSAEVLNINSAAMNTTSSISSTSAEVLNINSAAMNTTSSMSSTSAEVVNINAVATNITGSVDPVETNNNLVREQLKEIIKEQYSNVDGIRSDIFSLNLVQKIYSDIFVQKLLSNEKIDTELSNNIKRAQEAKEAKSAILNSYTQKIDESTKELQEISPVALYTLYKSRISEVENRILIDKETLQNTGSLLSDSKKYAFLQQLNDDSKQVASLKQHCDFLQATYGCVSPEESQLSNESVNVNNNRFIETNSSSSTSSCSSTLEQKNNVSVQTINHDSIENYPVLVVIIFEVINFLGFLFNNLLKYFFVGI